MHQTLRDIAAMAPEPELDTTLPGVRGWLVALVRWLPVIVGLACVVILLDRLRGTDLAAVQTMLASIAPRQWAMAGVITLISFWALARYDALAHAHLKTGLAPRDALRSGFSAVAIGQMMGFAMVLGGLVRWKMLPGLAPRQVAGVVLAVSVLFSLSLAFWLGLSGLLPRGAVPLWAAALALWALTSLIALSIWRPRWRGQRLPIPSALHIFAALGWAGVDLLAAGLALYVLLPPESLSGLSLGFVDFWPLFLMAFAAGLYGATPGGVGPFELALLALMPLVDTPSLLAALLAFRVTYYLIPGAIGLAFVIWDHRQQRAKPAPHDPDHLAATTPKPNGAPLPAIAHAPQAETALVRQNGGRLINYGDTIWQRIDSGQTHIHLLDPQSGCALSALGALRRSARAAGRLGLLYKCSERTARAARAHGWHVMRLSDEAMIVPAQFDIEDPARRGLRRKLRQGAKAGIRIAALTPADVAGPYRADLTTIARDWSARRGGEWGLSMGRFSIEMLQDQKVFAAFDGQTMLGFVSFHHGLHELCLDLIRISVKAPDGTLHSLLHAAIQDSAKHKVPKLSLAAAPAEVSIAANPLHRKVLLWMQGKGGAGLRRLKQSFAPQWAPRYAAAPTRAELLLGLMDTARAIARPDNIDTS